jgi:uncharacterized iron-regulated membrane protein
VEDAWVSIANLPVIDQDLAAVPNAFIALNQERHTCVLFITPYPDVSAFQISSVDAQNRQLGFIADPVSGTILAQPRTWVEWMHDLYAYLLLGSGHGEQVNGVGAEILLLLCGTGLFLWWPGITNWSRGFRISLRSRWCRINFDTHHAIGIWTLMIVTWWSISGVYLAWYQPLEAAINAVFPVRGMLSPPLPQLTPNTSRARVLTVWHYGDYVTEGDWILCSMFTLHFGTVWGLPIKILWSLLGVSLAVLSITRLIMYWNRYLRYQLG